MIKKHFFFDLDDTITRSRSEITPQMATALGKMIDAGCDVIIVSGAKLEQMGKQLGKTVETVFTLSQNGNDAMTDSGRALWKNQMNWVQKRAVFNFIQNCVKGSDQPEFKDLFDLVEDRGCQVSYSLIGHNEDLGKKKACDPQKELRLRIMDRWKHLIPDFEEHGVHWAIGGTTCIDFYIFNKGENVAKLIAEMEWNKDECVYVGDALFAGGNDETVRGVVDVVEVEDSAHCLDWIKEVLQVLPKPAKVDEVDEDEEDEEDDSHGM